MSSNRKDGMSSNRGVGMSSNCGSRDVFKSCGGAIVSAKVRTFFEYAKLFWDPMTFLAKGSEKVVGALDFFGEGWGESCGGA